MKYIRFNKDNAQTGNKKGEIIKVVSKIPPQLERYVTETTKGVYDKYQNDLLDQKEAEEDQKLADASNQETSNVGNGPASGGVQNPDHYNQADLQPDQVSDEGKRTRKK